MMMILGETRDRLISELGIPSGALNLTRGVAPHPELAPWCRKLSLSLEPVDYVPNGIDLVPLWEGENSITGFFISSKGRTFIKYNIEDIEHYTVLGDTFESAIKNIIDTYIEKSDVADVVASLGISRDAIGM